MHCCSPGVGKGGRTQVLALHGGSIGKKECLRLTEPATRCHIDVHRCIQGNIHLAALDLTCRGTSECMVQVAEHMVFPTPLGEGMKCVCLCRQLSGIVCLFTGCAL